MKSFLFGCLLDSLFLGFLSDSSDLFGGLFGRIFLGSNSAGHFGSFFLLLYVIGGKNNLAFRVSMAFGHVRHDESLPLNISLEFLDDPFAVDNGCLSTSLIRCQQI